MLHFFPAIFHQPVGRGYRQQGLGIDEQTVLVFMNKNTEALQKNIEYMQEVMPNRTTAFNLFTQKTQKLGKTIELPAMSATVLVINKPQ